VEKRRTFWVVRSLSKGGHVSGCKVAMKRGGKFGLRASLSNCTLYIAELYGNIRLTVYLIICEEVDKRMILGCEVDNNLICQERASFLV
jgi:hypothetical protein